MKTFNIETIFEDENFSFIEESIKRNGVFIYPTDTIYGIGGNFYSLEVIEKIDSIKKRGDKPYSVAVSDFEMLKSLVETIPQIFIEDYMKLLPGKFTFLFEVKKTIDKKLIKNSNKIGIRILDNRSILKLIKKIDTPIITTSVNTAGNDPINSSEKILEFIEVNSLQDEIDFIIVDDGNSDFKGSTIIDITVNPPKYLRY